MNRQRLEQLIAELKRLGIDIPAVRHLPMVQ